ASTRLRWRGALTALTSMTMWAVSRGLVSAVPGQRSRLGGSTTAGDQGGQGGHGSSPALVQVGFEADPAGAVFSKVAFAGAFGLDAGLRGHEVLAEGGFGAGSVAVVVAPGAPGGEEVLFGHGGVGFEHALVSHEGRDG